jgi:hypothetical protein
VDDQEFSARLDDCISGALRAASASPDVKAEEPFLVELVALVRSEPARLSDATAVLCGLIPRMELEDGVLDLLEYCAHALRPRELLDAIQVFADSATRELGEGRSLHTRRLCEHVLAAAHDDWDGRDMYESLRSD